MRKTSALLVAVLAFGCATNSDVDRLRSQISELQEELANVKRTSAGKEEVQNVNQRIVNQTEMLLRSNATLIAKVDQMDERIQTTQGAVEQVTHRMDELAQQLTQAQRDVEGLKTAPAPAQPMTSTAPVPAVPTTPSSEVTVASTPGPQITEKPLDVYNAAYRDYQLANFDLAIAGFRDFLEKNATSDLADNAAYWIGESLFSQKKYRDAIEQFDTVVTRFPKSDKVPAALLKKGYSYLNLNERAQGIVQLQYVVHEHPNSQEAGLARQRLRALGVETR